MSRSGAQLSLSAGTLTTRFAGSEADWAPVLRAAWLCAIYTIIPIVAAYLIFLRGDVAGD